MQKKVVHCLGCNAPVFLVVIPGRPLLLPVDAELSAEGIVKVAEFGNQGKVLQWQKAFRAREKGEKLYRKHECS